ncbi:MAG: 2-C-methyl-D-erythritol 4-phosphate cytidylyltransferase [Fidelibacterota bacterium]
MSGSAGVIIPAAGSGSRFGEKKQFKPLGHCPLLYYSLRTFLSVPAVREIVVVVPAADEAQTRREIRSWTTRAGVSVTAGGARRQDSVANGLAQLSPDCDVICIHDAARPFVTQADIVRCLKRCAEVPAAILATPARDTLKQVNDAGRIKKTIDRGKIWQAQTPQCFQRSVLTEALSRAEHENRLGTDEAVLVESLGYSVVVVEGSSRNMKITTAEDWELALALTAYQEGQNNE